MVCCRVTFRSHTWAEVQARTDTVTSYKSRNEVGRLVSLMEKFSRKLVSKVIYIHILRSSTPKLLEAFLAESGWLLLSSW